MQPTLASLQLESLNPKWSQQQQNSFKWLAVLLEDMLVKLPFKVSPENQ